LKFIDIYHISNIFIILFNFPFYVLFWKMKIYLNLYDNMLSQAYFRIFYMYSFVF